MIDQRERFVRDELLQLIFGRPGARDVRRAGFRRNMVPPVPTQCVIIDREFSSDSLNRPARREQTLDPHAVEVITALTSPGSRATLSCHWLFPPLYFKKLDLAAPVCGINSWCQTHLYSAKLRRSNGGR
jgi:hypothetical protein